MSNILVRRTPCVTDLATFVDVRIAIEWPQKFQKWRNMSIITDTHTQKKDEQKLEKIMEKLLYGFWKTMGWEIFKVNLVWYPYLKRREDTFVCNKAVGSKVKQLYLVTSFKRQLFHKGKIFSQPTVTGYADLKEVRSRNFRQSQHWSESHRITKISK